MLKIINEPSTSGGYYISSLWWNDKMLAYTEKRSTWAHAQMDMRRMIGDGVYDAIQNQKYSNET